MTTNTPRISDANKMVAGAARLATIVRHQKADEEFKARGKIIYAVDTSILHMFMARENKKPGLFFMKSDSDFSALVGALTHFVFFGMQDEPLFVIPPHDVEILDVVNAKIKFAEHRTEVELTSVLELMSREHHSPEAAIKLLLTKAPTILGLLFGIGETGPIHEVERYRSLLKQKRIRNVIRLPEFPVPERGDLANIANRADDLFIELKKVKESAGRIQIMHDARVLAYLEWLNSRIGPDNVVHLIASDEALMSVVEREQKTARGHFVRDLRYFLIVAGKGQTAASGDIVGWIDEVLLAMCPKNTDYGTWLLDVANNPAMLPQLDESATLTSLKNLRERLKSFVEQISLSYGLRTSSAPEWVTPSKTEQDFLNYLKSNQSELEDILKRRIDETAKEIDRLAVMAGFYLIADGDTQFTAKLKELVDIRHGNVARAPAWFRFEHITDWTRRLYDALNSPKSTNIKDVATVFDWPGSDSQKQYEFRLVYAYVLSLGGHWEAAQNHCLRAKKIANDSIAQMHTFDAAYFRAVCLRHIAKSPDDMIEAEAELDDAEKSWASAHEGEADRDPRFLVERSVQKFVRWEFRNENILAGGTSFVPKEIGELEGIIGRMWGLWPAVWDEQTDSIRLPLAQQLFTNIGEATCIQRLILKIAPAVPADKLYEVLAKIRKLPRFSQDNLPRFPRLIYSLVDYMEAVDTKGSVERGVIRDDARNNLRKSMEETLHRFEDGMLRSLWDAIEPSS